MKRLAPSGTHPLNFLPGATAAATLAGVAALLMIPGSEARDVAGATPVTLPIVLPTVPPIVLPIVLPGSGRACASCGVVQTIRRTDGASGQTSYQFSVRMRDGSVRDSTGPTRGDWTEGDHVLLIGGSAARALEQEKNAAP